MKLANPRILTINGGSSSIKFALYQVVKPLERGLHGKVDRIGLSGTNLTFDDPPRKQQESRNLAASDHKSAANFLIDWLEERAWMNRQTRLMSRCHRTPPPLRSGLPWSGQTG